MSELLVVRDLCKAYTSGNQRLEILVNLSLVVSKGEMVAVTGVSGSGKSTLLHLLGGMERPDHGSIQVNGTEISKLTALELSSFRNTTVGFVFQFHHLLPEFTALENVVMPLLIRGEPPAKAAITGRTLLEQVELEKRSNHRPGELSGGEQQRVALARALAGNPRLLLADEPTGNLDQHTGEEINLLIHSLHQRHGLTSVLVTHNERLASASDTAYQLENGRLKAVGSSKGNRQ
jgi:lipoprotein-releasing system ATP-binding protein